MELPLNQIIQGDCLEVLKTFPDKSIDLVLTDPPYGMSYKRHILNPKFGAIMNDDNLNWLPDLVSDLWRVLKDDGNVYIFCSWHNIESFKIELSKVFTIRNMLIWDKGGGGMGDLETTYGSCYEICLYSNRSPQKLNGRRDTDVLKSRRTGNNLHPTEKPVDLMSYLLRKSTFIGDIVLDPFAGSGSTLVAAKQDSRNYIGIELSPEYCEIARKRVEGAIQHSLPLAA